MGDEFNFLDLFTPGTDPNFDDSFYQSLFNSGGQFDPTMFGYTIPDFLNDYTPSDPGAGGQYNALFGNGGSLTGLDAGNGSGNWLSTLGKVLFGSNRDGSVNLSSLLPILLSGGSGLYAMNQTKKATEQTVNAINSANDQIKSLLGGAQSLYDPYVQAGTSAIDRMSTQAPSNLAANYGPLASKYKPLASQGAVTLTRFARGK